MDMLKFNRVQEAFDNQECSDWDPSYQTQDEIDRENDRVYRYEALKEMAIDGYTHPFNAFCKYIQYCKNGNDKAGADLIFSMLGEAANYRGSRATVPNFVALFERSMEWEAENELTSKIY